jgi:sugar/nucleoside kinase (ribokinase family)
MSSDAVVAGLICLDIIPSFPGPARLEPGKVTEIGAADLATGGAVANTGLALHRLGIATRLMGKLGDDLFGQAVLGIVRSFDPALAEGMVVVPGETTSYTVVFSPPNVDRTFFHCPGANHSFGADDVRYELVSEARLFHLGYPPFMRRLYADGGRELAAILRRVEALGVTTSLDMALPDPNGPSGQVDWPALLAATLPHTGLFLPSAEEVCFMLDRARYDALQGSEPDDRDVRALAARCLDLGAKVVVVKCGARGTYVRTADAPRLSELGRAAPSSLAAWANRELWAPCFEPQPLVGTTGAGDAAVAGFLAALLRDQTLEQAVTMACAVGACNVEAADALSGVRTWDETLQRVRVGWARLPLHLSTPGWTMGEGGMWHGGRGRG